MDKSTDEVRSWLVENGFQEYSSTFYDNKIDGVALCHLTERVLEILMPLIGDRMKFLWKLELLKKGNGGISQEERGSLGSRSNSPSPCRSRTNSPSPGPSRSNSASEGEAEGVQLHDSPPAVSINSPTEGPSRYPTRNQMIDMSVLIVKTYPFLEYKDIGTGYDSWFAKLHDKFRNERKGNSDPEVVLHKRVKKAEEPKIKASLRRGAINWEPPFPEGEDEASMKKHKGVSSK